jgi:hypothetical protein
MLIDASANIANNSATDFLYRTQHELGLLSLAASLVPAAMAFFMAGCSGCCSSGGCDIPHPRISARCSSATLCSRFTRLALACAVCRWLLISLLHLAIALMLHPQAHVSGLHEHRAAGVLRDFAAACGTCAQVSDRASFCALKPLSHIFPSSTRRGLQCGYSASALVFPLRSCETAAVPCALWD